MPLVFDADQTNTSFSGADIRAIAYRPGFRLNPADVGNTANSDGGTFELGAIQTLSISTFRDKKEVRSLGFQGVQSYVRGSRTIAGTMIFSLLNKHPFNNTANSTSNRELLRETSGFIEREHWTDPGLGEGSINTVNRKHQYDFTWDSQLFGQLMYPDELPPIDIVITFANEAGALGKMVLFGVDILGEGVTLSIEDIFTEHTYQYVARGMSVFQDGQFINGIGTTGPSASQSDYGLSVLGDWPLPRQG